MTGSVFTHFASKAHNFKREVLNAFGSGGKARLHHPGFLINTDLPQLDLNGQVDEVRVSNTARSSARIRTQYNNQKSPASFYTVVSNKPAPGGILAGRNPPIPK